MAHTISLDFDGVIHSYERGWADGTVYGRIDTSLITHFQGKGLVVIVSTCRPVEQVGHVLRHYGFKVFVDRRRERTFWNNTEVVLITNLKVAASAYIDDRAVSCKFGASEADRQRVFDLVDDLVAHKDGWTPGRDAMGDPNDPYRHGDPLADADV